MKIVITDKGGILFHNKKITIIDESMKNKDIIPTDVKTLGIDNLDFLSMVKTSAVIVTHKKFIIKLLDKVFIYPIVVEGITPGLYILINRSYEIEKLLTIERMVLEHRFPPDTIYPAFYGAYDVMMISKDRYIPGKIEDKFFRTVYGIKYPIKGKIETIDDFQHIYTPKLLKKLPAEICHLSAIKYFKYSKEFLPCLEQISDEYNKYVIEYIKRKVSIRLKILRDIVSDVIRKIKTDKDLTVDLMIDGFQTIDSIIGELWTYIV